MYKYIYFDTKYRCNISVLILLKKIQVSMSLYNSKIIDSNIFINIKQVTLNDDS